MSAPAEGNPFNLLYVLDTLRRYFWYIAATVALACVTAAVLTMPFFYPPEFLASVTIYPTSPERFDVVNLFHEEPNIYLSGGAKDVERLENIANSERVRMYVIDSLNLWPVYGVDKANDASPKFYALRTFAGNVRTVRGAGNGLTIEAYDVDPQRAASIVNLIVHKTDELSKDMLNENKATILEAYQKSLIRLQDQMSRYNDSLRRMRIRYNVLRSLTQTEVLSEQILIAEGDLAAARARYQDLKAQGAAGAAQAQTEVKAQQARLDALLNDSPGAPMNLTRFREGLDRIKSLEDVCEQLALDLKNARDKVHYLESMNSTAYSTLLIPELAQPSDRKARPVRWVILAATLLISSLVSIIGAVLIDRLTALRPQPAA